MQDYEYAGLQRQLSFRAASRVLVPDAIGVEAMRRAGAAARKLFRYPGLKEDYYLADFVADPAVPAQLGVDARDASSRSSARHPRLPPITRATRSTRPCSTGWRPRTRSVAVVICATEGQAAAVRARADPSLIVPERAIDAQSLIACADLVVSAGGTMNREAVALGTPVYTIFSGRMGAVDEQLIAEGLLRPLADPGALELVKRTTEPGPRHPRDPELLVDAILEAVALMFVDGRPETIYALFAFLVAAVIAWLLVPVAERIAWRIGAVDFPNERSLHTDPTPEARRAGDLRRDRGGDDPLPALGRADPGAADRRGGDRRRRRARRRLRAQPAAEARRPDGRRRDPGAQRRQRERVHAPVLRLASTCAASSCSTSG